MAVVAAAPKYYTYKPGSAPSGQGANAIKLKGGQTLAFATGKGYYAKPAATTAHPYAAPTRPTPPPPPTDPYAPRTPQQINTAADALAQSQLTPQQDEIRRQQQLASDQAASQEQKITGLSTTTAQMLAGLAPADQAAYMAASQEEGQLGQGLATGVQNDVAAKVAADQQFMESQGQSGGSTVDPAALHDTLYELNGVLPGNNFAEQGAHAAEWANAQPAIALNAGRAELSQAMATAKQTNDQYAQQLIQLAATYPGLKAQALQQLNQYEIDKANYRLNAAHTKKSDALAARSERAQEKAAGIDASIKKGALNYKWASLQFQSQKAIDKAKQSGKIIDVGASKLLGHIVYKDGSQDPSIKVAKSGSGAKTPGGITAAEKVRARATANTTAFKYATTLLGKPVPAPKGSQGAYVARSSGVPKSAVFPPAYPGGPRTTNIAKYANRASGASGWQDAFSKTWAAIDGDTLVQSYGYTREQVTAWVTAALRRAGWKRK